MNQIILLRFVYLTLIRKKNKDKVTVSVSVCDVEHMDVGEGQLRQGR